ncbi:hypothetical protein ACH437_29465 [Streptomyces xinghaiensis]|uniref:hypothetical protein n=1 Tax=Streptomyces xinghaiensis TaxID=1038928 RepID=UPI00379324C2
MLGETGVPEYDTLVDELRLVREKGLGNLRRYAVPALHQVCLLAELTMTSREQEPAAIETLIREAVQSLGGGRSGDAAEYTFGLVSGTKLWPASDRRRGAAKAQGVSADRFRKGYEPLLIEQVAEGVLAVCHQAHLRHARMQLERRHPADSRLAVQWVERFEAYYRIWTPAIHLAGDLRAAISTRHEAPAEHLPWDPDSDEPFDPEDQARGYARYALYAYTRYRLELRKFMIRHGGLWLLSDTETEEKVADAIYRIGWHNPLNEDDDSWLRSALSEARGEESDRFFSQVFARTTGERIHDEWQEHVASCACPDLDQGEDGCQVHATITAAQEYCDLIDADWLKIADWYHPGARPPRSTDDHQLYAKHVKAVNRSGRQ